MPRTPDPEHVFLAWIDFMFNNAHKSLRRAYDVADESRLGPSTERGVEHDANAIEQRAQAARFVGIQLHLQAVQALVLPIAWELLDPRAELTQRLGLCTRTDTPAIDHQRLETYFCLAIAPASGAAQIRFNRRLWQLLRERMFLVPAIGRVFPDDVSESSGRKRQVKPLSHLARETLFWASRGPAALEVLASELASLVVEHGATSAHSIQMQQEAVAHWGTLQQRSSALASAPDFAQTQACLHHLERKLRQDLTYGGAALAAGATARPAPVQDLENLSPHQLAVPEAGHSRPVSRSFPFQDPALQHDLARIKQVIADIYGDDTAAAAARPLARQAFSRRLLLVYSFVLYTYLVQFESTVPPLKTKANPSGLTKGAYYRRYRQEAVDCLVRFVAWDDDPATGNALRWLSRVRYREWPWGEEFRKRLTGSIQRVLAEGKDENTPIGGELKAFIDLFQELAQERSDLQALYGRHALSLANAFDGDTEALREFLGELNASINAGLRALAQEHEDEALFLDEYSAALDGIRAYEELERSMVIFVPLLEGRPLAKKTEATPFKRVFNFFTRPWKRYRERASGGWTTQEWRYVADRLGTEPDDSCPMFIHYCDLYRRLAPFALIDADLRQAFSQLRRSLQPADCCATH